MPLYDMQCEKCKKQVEIFCKIKDIKNQKCSCGGRLKILITNYHNQDWFKPHWNEHFTDKPVFVRSKRHMKELCLKYNVTSKALGDIRNVTEI